MDELKTNRLSKTKVVIIIYKKQGLDAFCKFLNLSDSVFQIMQFRPWNIQGVEILIKDNSESSELSKSPDSKSESLDSEILVWRDSHLVYGNASWNYTNVELCPYFKTINDNLIRNGKRPIIWDIVNSPIVAFSDGSCSLNGKPNARASFASLIVGGQFASTIVRGEVHPFKYTFIDKENLKLGICPTNERVAPSNNRGELLGIIYVFLTLLRGNAIGNIELVSDSKISINTLLVWLPSRIKKKTEKELKNYDLVDIAWQLLIALRKYAIDVALTHINSHQPKPSDSASSREKFIWRGNDIVDKHAGDVLTEQKSNYSINIVIAPSELKKIIENV